MICKNSAEPVELRYILGRWGYEMPCLVGRGAFSKVYRVREIATGRYFACKASNGGKVLEREALLLQQIVHPLFPEFHEIRQEGGCTFLFLEFVHGTSLGTLLARRGTLSERQAIRIGRELAEGLCYLQERETPVMFRDLKSENIIIRQDGRVKLVDFGSAGTADPSAVVRTGTPGYAAPEQLSESGIVGLSGDVYALGKVMCHMLTGRNPAVSFGEDDGLAKYGAKGYRGVEQLVHDCIIEEPAERIPDMRCFLGRLAPYDTVSRSRILQLEIKAYLNRGYQGEYVFQRNILKTSD